MRPLYVCCLERDEVAVCVTAELRAFAYSRENSRRSDASRNHLSREAERELNRVPLLSGEPPPGGRALACMITRTYELLVLVQSVVMCRVDPAMNTAKAKTASK